jgi:hypothetical protein
MAALAQSLHSPLGGIHKYPPISSPMGVDLPTAVVAVRLGGTREDRPMNKMVTRLNIENFRHMFQTKSTRSNGACSSD